MGRVNPGSQNAGELKECGDYHDEHCNSSSCGPCHGCGILSLDSYKAVGGVEIIKSDMDDENSVEVHEEMSH